jgi:hypothetical protein
LRDKWGVAVPTDPGYTMDLLTIQKDRIAQRAMPIPLDTSVKRIWVWLDPKPINPHWRLDLYICLAGPKNDIVDQVESAIDIELLRRRKESGQPKKTRKRINEYATYLKVWDSFQSLKSYRRVAKDVWPDQLSHWETDALRNRQNPSNPIIQRAKDHYQAACRLIEGGYKDLR